MSANYSATVIDTIDCSLLFIFSRNPLSPCFVITTAMYPKRYIDPAVDFVVSAAFCFLLVCCAYVFLDQVNAALAEVSVIHNKIFLESFWADLDEVMTLKDCEVSLRLLVPERSTKSSCERLLLLVCVWYVGALFLRRRLGSFAGCTQQGGGTQPTELPFGCSFFFLSSSDRRSRHSRFLVVGSAAVFRLLTERGMWYVPEITW